MISNKVSAITSSDKSNISYSDMAQYGKNASDKFSVDTQDTDGTNDLTEITYTPNWRKWHGYYRKIPEFHQVINVLAFWSLGKGIKTSEENKKKLERIHGWGKDSFEDIMENIIRCSLVCGDGFGEIIKDSAGRITNIKPLNSGKIEIVVNQYGIIKEYRQTGTQTNWMPKEIFHLSWARIGDEIHGIPFPEKLESLIEMIHEAMEDQKIVFHRYVKPLTIIPVKTDDAAEISAIATKYNNSYTNTENLIIPDEVVDTDKIKNIAIPQYATLDPLNWLNHLQRLFVTSCGVPEIIMGWGRDTTEASSKIIYLSFQQTIEQIQQWVEKAIKNQLGMEIELEFPADLMEALQTDQKKDKGQMQEKNINPVKNG